MELQKCTNWRPYHLDSAREGGASLEMTDGPFPESRCLFVALTAVIVFRRAYRRRSLAVRASRTMADAMVVDPVDLPLSELIKRDNKQKKQKPQKPQGRGGGGGQQQQQQQGQNGEAQQGKKKKKKRKGVSSTMTRASVSLPWLPCPVLTRRLFVWCCRSSLTLLAASSSRASRRSSSP